MKEIKIPGSKFLLTLDDDENQWFLRLRIHNAVEEEIALTHLEKKALRLNIEGLLKAAHLNLNELQVEMIQTDIWEFIQQKLNQEGNKRQFGTINDPRYDELVGRIDRLSKEIEELTELISSKEQILT